MCKILGNLKMISLIKMKNNKLIDWVLIKRELIVHKRKVLKSF